MRSQRTRVAERAELDALVLDRRPHARVAERLELHGALDPVGRLELLALARMADELGHAFRQAADESDHAVGGDALVKGCTLGGLPVEAPLVADRTEVP